MILIKKMMKIVGVVMLLIASQVLSRSDDCLSKYPLNTDPNQKFGRCGTYFKTYCTIKDQHCSKFSWCGPDYPKTDSTGAYWEDGSPNDEYRANKVPIECQLVVPEPMSDKPVVAAPKTTLSILKNKLD